MTTTPDPDALAVTRLMALATMARIVISVAYGPIGGGVPGWTVTALRVADGAEFDQPYAARSFVHAVEIVVTEAAVRGWV